MAGNNRTYVRYLGKGTGREHEFFEVPGFRGVLNWTPGEDGKITNRDAELTDDIVQSEGFATAEEAAAAVAERWNRGRAHPWLQVVTKKSDGRTIVEKEEPGAVSVDTTPAGESK